MELAAFGFAVHLLERKARNNVQRGRCGLPLADPMLDIGDRCGSLGSGLWNNITAFARLFSTPFFTMHRSECVMRLRFSLIRRPCTGRDGS